MSLFKKSLDLILEHNYIPKVQGFIPSVEAILLILDVKSHQFSIEKTDSLLFQTCEYFFRNSSFKDDEEMISTFYEYFHKQLRVSYLFEIHDNQYEMNEHYNFVLYKLFDSTNFGFILSTYVLMEYIKSNQPDFITSVMFIENLLITEFESLMVCKY